MVNWNHFGFMNCKSFEDILLVGVIRKGSVITVNNTPLLSVVYVIISFSCCCSLSTLMVESHPSFMSASERSIHLWNFYLLGPEIYCYDLFKWKHIVVLITLIRKHFTFKPLPKVGFASNPRRNQENEIWTSNPFMNPVSSTRIERFTNLRSNPPKIPNFKPTNWVRPDTSR